MPDKPILFSGPMVRALLAGTKTQTRRALQKPKWADDGSDFEIEADGPYIVAAATGCTAKVPMRIAVGDRLWVRENWSHTGTGVWRVGDVWNSRDGGVIYQADASITGAKYWPSIHMPRAFSRLTLTVTDVRVEPLQDISDRGAQNDCTAEGVFHSSPVPSYDEWHGAGFRSSEKFMYRQLWEAINGPGSWDANPWVAAYTFTVERGNIDSLAVANG